MRADRCELLCLDLEVAARLRKSRFSIEQSERAAVSARPLGDPTRLMLAAVLLEGQELCVCDLARIAEPSQNLVSHHLRSLRAAGLLRSRRDGKMVMYAPTSEGAALVEAVLAPDPLAHR